ncbi:MAG TPA: ABC transporter permease [Chthoniobacterales bacterium]|jgi:ABC-2 type transport system permease protein|nr:ABC transporter permease [Chthoniobacterales bacterium]
MSAAAASAGARRSGLFFLPTVTLWQREIVRFYRQRNRIIGALLTPFVFWFLIGSGIGPSFRAGSSPNGVGYLEYFYPGTLILIMLFTAIFSTISIIEDRREGFLQSVLVAPISPGSIVCGKILGGTTLALMQGFIFLLLAPFVGIHITPERLLVCLGTLFVVGFGLTGLGFLVAWPMESTQGFHAIMNVFLIPLWLMSGALFPATNPHSWIFWAIHLNPVTYGVAAVRRALYAADPGVLYLPSFTLSIGLSVAFGLIMYVIAYFLVQRKSS